jgi:hypothetical protein
MAIERNRLARESEQIGYVDVPYGLVSEMLPVLCLSWNEVAPAVHSLPFIRGLTLSLHCQT